MNTYSGSPTSGIYTALEYVLHKLWSQDKKEQCYDILDHFVTWKAEEKPNKNLKNLLKIK